MLKTVYCTPILLLVIIVYYCHGQDVQLGDLRADNLPQRLLAITANSNDRYAALKFKQILWEAQYREFQLTGGDVEAVVFSILKNQGNRRGERMLVSLRDACMVNYNSLLLTKEVSEHSLTFAAYKADRSLREGIPLVRGLINAGASPNVVEFFTNEQGEKYQKSLLSFWEREARLDFQAEGYDETDFDEALRQIAQDPTDFFKAPRALYIYYELSQGLSLAPRSMLAHELKKEIAAEPLIKVSKVAHEHKIKLKPKRCKKVRLADSYEMRVAKKPTTASLLRKKATTEHLCVCDYCGAAFK